MYNTIEIDFDVFKALTQRRVSEEYSYNDVLRDLLGLGEKRTTTLPPLSTGDWISKGVRFPAGTEFRLTHKGQTTYGRIEGGGLIINGIRFGSLSAAAKSITNTSVDGWILWEYRFPGKGSWRQAKSLRM